MHETKSKMYAWNYVVPWHHTYSGYATGLNAWLPHVYCPDLYAVANLSERRIVSYQKYLLSV